METIAGMTVKLTGGYEAQGNKDVLNIMFKMRLP